MQTFVIVNENGDFVEVANGQGSDGADYVVTQGFVQRVAGDGEITGEFDLHADRAAAEAAIADLPSQKL